MANTWTTTFRGANPKQDPTPVTSVQPDLSTPSDSEYVEDPLGSGIKYQQYLEDDIRLAVAVLRDKLDTLAKLLYNDNGTIKLPAYSKSSLPSASPAGQLIFVTDDVGGSVPAFSDGTHWLRVTDRFVVS